MRSVSAMDLLGDQHRRFTKNRREIYRSVLRDPRATEQAKAQAREKLEALKAPKPR